MKQLAYTVLFCIVFLGEFYWTVSTNQQRTPRQTESEELQGRSGALEALDFWTRSRAYPDQDIPSDKYFKAFQYAKRTFKEKTRSEFSLTSWQSIGPTNLSGRAISVAVNPLNPQTIYVGSASGGLWRSHTSGLTGDWQRITTGYPVLGVGAIAIDPTDSNSIYIGTGEVYRYQIALTGLVVRTTRGSFGMGILKTTNNGVTWTKSLDWSTQQQRGVQAIKMNPLNPHTLFAATTQGLYKTTNAGATWSALLFTSMAEDILINPLDTNTILLSTGNLGANAHVYKTTDGGGVWNQVPDLPSFTGKTLLEMYGANPNTVYADVADSTTGVGSLWKSTNFGSSWAVINNNPGDYTVQGWYSHFIVAHPTDSTKIFHASVSAIKSTDGGTSWTGSGFNLYSDNHAFARDPSNPDILYVADDDGIYRSTDFGSTFTYIGNNLQTGQFYNGFSNSASDSLLAIGQVQDHIPGYIYQGSTTWGRSASDEVGWTAINQSNDNFMFAVTRNGQSVARSTNRGVSFSGSVGFGGFGAWNSPLVLSPSNTSVLYLGKDKIYKSINGGTSFSATNGNVLIDGGNPALCMAMSSTNPDTVYAGIAPYVTAAAHMYRTTNGGTSWTNITGTLPNLYPLDLAVDPTNSQAVYATFGGFGSGHVFKSTNTGSGWTDITGTLPDVPTGAVFVDPLNSNYVYVGNDIGVYVSTDGGSSWSSFSEGLPDAVLVSDLSYTPSNRTLRATTHGNGIFQFKLPTALPSVTIQSPNGGESFNATTSQTITWNGALVSLVNLDYSTDNGATWLPIASNIPASLPNYNWVVPNTITSNARVRVSSSGNPAINDQSNSVFTIYFTGAVLTVNKLWNLISLPITAPDQRTTTLFPTASSNAFAYEGSYVVEDTMKNGVGYWLKFNSDSMIAIGGDPFTDDTLSIVTGWNLIGSLNQSIAANSIASVPPGIVTSQVFGFNGVYFTTDSLRPGKGYWIKTSQDGQLILSSSSATPSANRIHIVETSEVPPPAPSDELSHDKPVIPATFELSQNYPNPFNPTTTIRYQITDRSHVILKVYDILGKEVYTLVDETQDAGFKSVTWNAINMPSGIYVVRLIAGNFVQSRKTLLTK